MGWFFATCHIIRRQLSTAMKKYLFLLPAFWLCMLTATAQKISGQWKQLPNSTIRLEGFDGFKAYPIASDSMDKSGRFSLAYTQKDYGIGCLIAGDNKPLFVVLSGEDIVIQGDAPGALATVEIVKGDQNIAFAQYATQQPKREQALSAWVYLENLYRSDSLFTIQPAPQKAITAEMQRIRQEDDAFIAALPENSYVRWFLPVRKLVSNVSAIAQYRTDEIPATLRALRALNYADERLYKSGLFKDAIDNHIWFIENTSGSLDSVFADINRSIDAMLQPLVHDEKKYNAFTGYLFDLLEQRSLTCSSEYLALKVLNDKSCGINADLANKLEGYRKLKKGSKAPDIVFPKHTVFPQGTQAGSLKDIQALYKLVVFGAGWCGHCQEIMPKLAALYPQWKSKGIEIVFVSLDETATDFNQAAGKLPFIATCDFQKWKGKAVTDYHVFATPTYYLLDENLKIVLKPVSVEQIDAWVNMNDRTGKTY